MTLKIPELALVLLVGPSGSGKSTFGRTHFGPGEVVSSDLCREMVSNDESSLDATSDAFELLHFIVRKRLQRGLLTVVDATNVQAASRASLVKIAREFYTPAVAIVLGTSAEVCAARNAQRPNRQFGSHVIRNQIRDLRRDLRNLKREGFMHVYTLETLEDVEASTIERAPMFSDRKAETGPFDIIGDVHGCFAELSELLQKLGWTLRDGVPHHPEGRKLVFVGDLVDRGPDSPSVLKLVMRGTVAGTVLAVPGNHDIKLSRKLRGHDVALKHGLAETMRQLAGEPDEFVQEVATFLYDLVSHLVLDGGRLVVAHAGMREEMAGRASPKVRDFALYGETTGETDEFGLPVRYPWAADYRGNASVIYGHTPVTKAEWLNNTLCIDTGCVFGGQLTALRWPEKTLVAVPAHRVYSEPIRPLAPATKERDLQQLSDEVLELGDLLEKRGVETRLRGRITIRPENAIPALETLSRFAVDPRWLPYLPPTMSPCETSTLPGTLEHPAQAFEYFASAGETQVICEEKHMGSRSVIAICRDAKAATQRFGITSGETGMVVTRTGRPFFSKLETKEEFLSKLRATIDHAALWAELETDWLLLDAEIMPWSAKAQELLNRQYAPVGVSAVASTAAGLALLEQASIEELAPLLDKYRAKHDAAQRFVEAYQRYNWPVRTVSDLKVAPFHVLASEGRTFVDQSHVWHMQTLAKLANGGDGFVVATPYREVNLEDPASLAAATEWWEQLTARGGEGMVVKPQSFTFLTKGGLGQPAIKVRGREYLRIIYGPEYLLPEHLERLRSRKLGRKRGLALSEFALGVEALERFVAREPLRRVHECVFGVLALESDEVDPRL